jgi:hypothetical protein
VLNIAKKLTIGIGISQKFEIPNVNIDKSPSQILVNMLVDGADNSSIDTAQSVGNTCFIP